MNAEQFLTPNGWADDRLMQAYDLIWGVAQANHALGLNRVFAATLHFIQEMSTDIAEAKADAAEAAMQTLADELAGELDRETGE